MLNFESDRHPGIVIQWTSGKIVKLFFAKRNAIACSDILIKTLQDYIMPYHMEWLKYFHWSSRI